MKNILSIIFILFLNTFAFSSDKESVIKSLDNIKNLSFNFEQSINGKVETGKCIIEYPKKFYANITLLMKNFSFKWKISRNKN